MIIIDSHNDSPSQMYRQRDFGVDNHHAQVDFPKMLKAGIGASFFAMYISPSYKGADATEYAYKLIKCTEDQVRTNADKIAFARTAEEVEINHSKGLTSIIMALENGSAIQEDFSIMKDFYDRGLRYITLTHSADNQIGDSCTGKGTWGGLSPFGKELIPEMNRLGMMIDVAHTSEATVYDVLERSISPVVYTHGCCKALCDHKRNLTDAQIKAIADSQGIVGMSVYPCFLDKDFRKILDDSKLEEQMWIEDEFIADPGNPLKREAWEELQDKLNSLVRPSVGRVVDHIDHAVEVAGIDHVGIGTDYDGIEVTPVGMENISGLNLIFKEMERRGYKSSEIEKVAGLNWLEVMKKIAKYSIL